MKRPRIVFTGLFLLSLGLIWGGTWNHYQTNQDQRLRDARTATAYQAQTFAAAGTATIKRLDALLLELRSSWEFDRQNFAKTVQLRQADIFDLGFQVAMIGPDGMLVYSSLTPTPDRVYLGDREHFRVHADGDEDELFISHPLRGKVSGKWSIQFTRRVMDNGRFAGVLVLSVSPDALVEISQHLGLASGDVVSIISAKGEMLARAPDGDSQIGKMLTNLPFLEENAPEQGNYQRLSQADGVERLSGFYKVPRYGMTFLVSRKVETLLASQKAEMRTILLGAGLLTVLAAFTLFLLYRWTKLRAKAQAIQARLAAIVDASGDAIISYDEHDRVMTWNVGAERLFGYGIDECLERPRAILIPAEALEAEAEVRQAVMDGRGLTQRQTIRQLKNGEKRMVSISAFPVTVEDGKGGAHHGMAEIIHDISEQKRIEATLIDTVEKLTIANSEMERYAIIAAHDLREPTRTISSYARILQMQAADKLDEDDREALHHLVTGAKRLYDMIGGLQDVANLPHFLSSPRPVDLTEACQAVLENLEGLIRDTGTDVQVGPLPQVIGDKLQLIQVFQNLIGNSIKFRQPGGEPAVRIMAERHDREWWVAVQDNGIGFDPTEQDVFDLFRQLGARDTRTGTGTGLAICKRIIQHFGGRIWVESTPGQGSIFWFSLPIVQDAAPPAHQA